MPIIVLEGFSHYQTILNIKGKHNYAPPLRAGNKMTLPQD